MFLLSHEGLLAIAALRAVMDVGCSELQRNGSCGAPETVTFKKNSEL